MSNTNVQQPPALPEWSSRWLSVEEAAGIAGLTEKAMRGRLARGQGPRVARLSPRCLRISGQHLREWLEGALVDVR